MVSKPDHSNHRAHKPLLSVKDGCTNANYSKSFNDDLTHAATTYDIDGDQEAVMLEIENYGSVTADLTLYEDLATYKSGVYEHAYGGSMGPITVRIIGWGEEKGVPYWLCANSWNEHWGDKGLFKIRRGVNECGVEKHIYAGIAWQS